MSSVNARIDLRPTARSVSTARRVVGELLVSWGAPQDRQDAELLVTELVANVIDHVHGEPVISLEVELAGDWLRIAVADGSSVRPVVRELDRDRPRGRGLQLVQGIADRWGAEDHDGGKRVWFELAPPAV